MGIIKKVKENKKSIECSSGERFERI